MSGPLPVSPHGDQDARRRGSVVGVQPDGVDIYFPSGRTLRFPGWTARVVMQDLTARRGIYGGIRPVPRP